MSSLYDERRKQIKLENHAARKLLLNNVEEFKLTDIVSFEIPSLPDSIKKVVDRPGNLISGGDLIGRAVLPKGNIIRRIFQVLSSLKRVYKFLTEKNNSK